MTENYSISRARELVPQLQTKCPDLTFSQIQDLSVAIPRLEEAQANYIRLKLVLGVVLVLEELA